MLSLGADFGSIVSQFPGVDDIAFNGWDANLQEFSPTSFECMAAAPAVEVAPSSTAPSSTDSCENREDVDNDNELTNSLSCQLISLNKTTTEAMQSLARQARAPLIVSSHEVNAALDGTNTLIRIINTMTTMTLRDRMNPIFTDCGLKLLALASYQQLTALFQAICHAIRRCLHSRKERQQEPHSSQQYRDLEQSSNAQFAQAQFVMVLQLLMHLVNRMNRSLFPNNLATWDASDSRCTATISTPSADHYDDDIDPVLSEAVAGSLSPHVGFLVIVEDAVRKIPNEHDKLRQTIQKLQTEIEQFDLH